MKKTLYTLILAILGLSIIPISPLEAQIELSATFQKDYVRQEKRKLKKKVREINDLVDEGKISENEAQKMKEDAALEHAKNINDYLEEREFENAEEENLQEENEETKRNSWDDYHHRRRNRYRNSSQLVFGFGWYNLHSSEAGLFQREYLRDFQSTSIELGWNHRRSLFEKSSNVNLAIGLSYTWNRLNFQEGFIYEEIEDQVLASPTNVNYNSVKFISHDILLPIMIEHSRLGIAIGGYGGLNVKNVLKTSLEMNDEEIKTKESGNFNKTRTYFGLMGTLRIGDINVFVRRNLNPVFTDNDENEYGTVLGFRFYIW